MNESAVTPALPARAASRGGTGSAVPPGPVDPRRGGRRPAPGRPVGPVGARARAASCGSLLLCAHRGRDRAPAGRGAPRRGTERTGTGAAAGCGADGVWRSWQRACFGSRKSPVRVRSPRRGRRARPGRRIPGASSRAGADGCPAVCARTRFEPLPRAVRVVPRVVVPVLLSRAVRALPGPREGRRLGGCGARRRRPGRVGYDGPVGSDSAGSTTGPTGPRERSSMAEPQSSKLATRVRFPSFARARPARPRSDGRLTCTHNGSGRGAPRRIRRDPRPRADSWCSSPLWLRLAGVRARAHEHVRAMARTYVPCIRSPQCRAPSSN